MPRDHIGIPGVKFPDLVADREDKAALDDESGLLVVMVVLRNPRIGDDVDECHLHVFSRDGAGDGAIPDLVRLHRGERVEDRHRFQSTFRSMIVAVPMPPPQHIVSRP